MPRDVGYNPARAAAAMCLCLPRLLLTSPSITFKTSVMTVDKSGSHHPEFARGSWLRVGRQLQVNHFRASEHQDRIKWHLKAAHSERFKRPICVEKATLGTKRANFALAPVSPVRRPCRSCGLLVFVSAKVRLEGAEGAPIVHYDR